jgi:hypothetical protein
VRGLSFRSGPGKPKRPALQAGPMRDRRPIAPFRRAVPDEGAARKATPPASGQAPDLRQLRRCLRASQARCGVLRGGLQDAGCSAPEGLGRAGRQAPPASARRSSSPPNRRRRRARTRAPGGGLIFGEPYWLTSAPGLPEIPGGGQNFRLDRPESTFSGHRRPRPWTGQFGRIARLQESLPEGPEGLPKPPFHR